MHPHQGILKWPYNISRQPRELQQTLRRWKLPHEYLDHLLWVWVSWCKSLPQRTRTLPQCTQQKFASQQRLTRRLMQQEKILDCYQWVPLSTGKPYRSFFPFLFSTKHVDIVLLTLGNASLQCETQNAIAEPNFNLKRRVLLGKQFIWVNPEANRISF